MRVRKCASVGLAAMVLAAGGGSAGDCEPVLVGALDVPLQVPTVIRVSEDLACIGEFSRLRLVDVSSPGHPVLLTTMQLDLGIQAIDLANEKAYLVGNVGLAIVDMSDPMVPDLLSTFPLQFGLWSGVWVQGATLFVGDGYPDVPFFPTQGGLLSIDATDPASPFINSRALTPGMATDIVLDGRIAYVADGWAGVAAVDVANGASPTVVGRFDPAAPLPGSIQWIDRTGHVLVACETDRVVVADVTTPEAPFPRGEIMLGQPRQVACAGDTAVMTSGLPDGTRQVAVVSVANPADPVLRHAFVPSGGVMAMTLVGSRLYVTNPTRGLVIYDLSGCIGTMACSLADVAEPYGVLNIDDVLAYLGAFAAGDSLADVAPPAGTLDIDDVLTFLDAFAAGCP